MPGWTSCTRSTRPRTCVRSPGWVSGSRCTPARAARCSWPPTTRSASSSTSASRSTRFTASTITAAEALRTELDRVREQRYAVSRDEEEEGLSGIAAGILGPNDELLGVLSVGGPTQRLDRTRGRRAIDHLLQAAAQVEAVLRRGNRAPAALKVIGRAGS